MDIGATRPDRAELPFSPSILEILRSAERMEVLVLRDADPQPEVVGRGWVADSTDRAEFVRQFLATNWWPDGEEMCFDAECAVRVIAPAGEVGMEFCFNCSNVCVSGPGGGTGIIPFERGPGRLFWRLARKAGASRPWWRFWG